MANEYIYESAKIARFKNTIAFVTPHHQMRHKSQFQKLRF